MQVAVSEKPWVSLAAVNLLGDLGTAKCLPLLSKGLTSRNLQLRQACRDAVRKVRLRIKEAREKNKSRETSRSSGPAKGSGVFNRE